MIEPIERLRREGRLEIVAGAVVRAEARAARARVVVRPRGSGALRTIEAARVINCTGPASDPALSGSPIIGRLLRDGILRADPLGLGIETDDALRVIGSEGAASAAIYALGPMTRGRDWEMTAVPELREQAAALAQQLLGVRAAAAGS